MNEKQFARYLRAVRRRLTLPKKMKDRVMDNLRSSINERREAGQTDAEILAALGSAKQAASELTAQLPGYAFRKSPLRFICLGAAVLALLVGLLKTVTNLRGFASIGVIGGADGPMVLFASLKLSPHLFVPITVVAYMYLGLAYGGFPYLVKLLVPKKLQAIEMPPDDPKLKITSGQKLTFAVVACVLLSFLFPVASPLFFSLFLGIAIRESGLEKFQHLVSEIVLYGSTLMLGLLLGVLCEAKTIMDPKVLPLLIFGMAALALSGVGGILGGYFMYFVTRGKFNPVIGIAGVSCVPSTAKVAQKCVTRANPNAIIMHYALGVNIFGVITTAIIAAIYISLLQNS